MANALGADLLRLTAARVEAEIERLLPRQAQREAADRLLGEPRHERDLEALWRGLAVPIWDLLDRGGKRWRPALVVLAFEAVSGEWLLGAGKSAPASGSVGVWQAAAAVELLHNATLVADDIEDSSPLRRGRPSLHIAYGLDVATNAGDALYFMGYELLLRLPALEALRWRLLAVVNRALLACHAGQALDILWHREQEIAVSEEQYLEMCAQKTGALPAIALQLGALLGGASPETVSALGRCGERLGVAFQIHDDVLNVSPSRLSELKGLGEDIHEGKRTLAVLRALAQLAPSDACRLRQILGAHTDDPALVGEAIELLGRGDGLRYASARAGEMLDGCIVDLCATVPLSSGRERLEELLRFLACRKV